MPKADNLPPSCAVVTKSGNLNFLEPSGPFQTRNGTDLPLPLLIINYGIIINSISTIMCTVWYVDKYKITFKLVIHSRRISRGPVPVEKHCPKLSTWRAVHSCNYDRQLTINSQKTFIRSSNFELDVAFRPVT